MVSLISLLEQGAASRLHAPAVRAGPRTWSCADLDREATALCRYFARSGLQAGDRVAVMIRNSGELVVTLFACMKCGLAYTPLNFRYSASETLDVLTASRPTASVVGSEYRELVDSVRSSLSHLRLLSRISLQVQGGTQFCTMELRSLGRDRAFRKASRYTLFDGRSRWVIPMASAVRLTGHALIRGKRRGAKLVAATGLFEVA
jgi:acyl-CoA synthetase (AMP-forming)/AMP-acid ligase II